MAKKKTPKAQVKVQVSISVPTTLVAKIDKLADKVNRNRSNYISNELVRLLES